MPQTIGRLSAFMGNTGVLLRAYIYMRMLGRDGMHRVSEFATLNANYLMARLAAAGFELAYPGRRASHEFILTLKREAREYGMTAMDFAKRLLDYGFHAPTTYFPLLVPECLLIEPTETESKEDLDAFVDAMVAIRGGGQVRPSETEGRAIHAAGTPARRRARREATRPGLENRLMREGRRPTGFARLWLATLNSVRGLRDCYRSEAAFRQELWLAAVLIPAALWFGRDRVERALLVGSMLLVLIVELLNTGIEVVVDRIGTEHNHLSGFAKDVGSSAVLLSLLLLAATWTLVLLPQ